MSGPETFDFETNSHEAEETNAIKHRAESLGYQVKTIQTEAGNIFCVANFDVTIDGDLALLLTSFAKVVSNKSEITQKNNCAKLAGTAVEILRTRLEKKDLNIGTISTGKQGGPVLKFWSEVGYDYHTLNYIEGESLALGVDFNALHTFGGRTADFTVFSVAANSLEEVETILGRITESKWD